MFFCVDNVGPVRCDVPGVVHQGDVLKPNSLLCTHSCPSLFAFPQRGLPAQSNGAWNRALGVPSVSVGYLFLDSPYLSFFYAPFL